MSDEHYFDQAMWQFRIHLDRRFWATSGGPAAIGFGVVNDYGDIVRTEARPHG